MTTIITFILIVGAVYLAKKVKTNKKIGGYSLTLISGVVVLLFAPFVQTLTGTEANGAIDTGVQISSTVFGIYLIGWSIVGMIKFKKEKTIQTNTPTEVKNI